MYKGKQNAALTNVHLTHSIYVVTCISQGISQDFWLKLSLKLDQDQVSIHKEFELIFGSNFGLTLIQLGWWIKFWIKVCGFIIN